MEHEPIFCNNCAKCCNDDYELIQGNNMWHVLCGSCYRYYMLEPDEKTKQLFDKETKKLNRLTTNE